MNKRRVHYVLSTHWDREWHQSFQDYRYRLVQLLDRVLDGLVDGRLKGPFQTDGQAIILEDYLEVRPERRQEVEQLAQAGRLVVGPWYTLPDEFLVSGESLVRNLQLGRRFARSLGAEPSNAGFVCDIFGHNSQLPQIFAGFSIRGGFLWRGLNTTATRHVRWYGADGTRLACYRFGPVGYSTFAMAVRRAFDHDNTFDAAQAAIELDNHLQTEAEHTETEPILLFDGGDHQEWDQRVYAVLVERMKEAGESFELAHTSLDEYLAEMLPQADRIETVVSGELREPGLDPAEEHLFVIPGVLSSRAWIKQANAECQTLLCHWAEPLSAFSHAVLGQEYPQAFLDIAWKWLLQNHAHDSIGGCSIDLVHEDMRYRFSQCRQIANRLATEAMRKLATNITGELAQGELRVVVFNPLTQPIEQTVELTLQLPEEWPMFNEFFGFEPKPAFRIYDAEGHEVPYQRLAQAMYQKKVQLHELKFPQPYRTHDVQVSLALRLPAVGYTTLTIRPGEAGQPTRYPVKPGLASSERSLENELLAVRIEANGSLTLTDKRTGQTYSRLLTFEDTADIGDGWFHGSAVNDQTFSSTAARAEVALVHNGPMLTTFRIRTTMAVPAAFQFGRMRREEQFTDLVIDSLVSLRPGADCLEIETSIDNTARDHRVRVLFPSGAQAQTYLADTPFDVVERAIALREDNHLYHELELETKPQQSWTAVYDEQRGLAVLSTGLMESAVRDMPERPIALTLFRSTGRTVFTNGEPNGQLLGRLTFRYWLTPLAGKPDPARLCRLGEQLAAGLRDVQLTARHIAHAGSNRQLPATASLLALAGPVVVTSILQAGGGLEIRMFNPGNERAQATLDLAGSAGLIKTLTSAQLVDFESQLLEQLPEFDGLNARLELEPKQIVTIRLS